MTPDSVDEADETRTYPAGAITRLPGRRVLEPGDAVAGYRILEFLGRGASSEVHLARTTGGDRVALKLFNPDPRVDELGEAERFEYEGEVLARLDHPNIVGLRGRGYDGRLHRPYLALELIPGRDLERVLRRVPTRRLAYRDAVFVVGRCARALEAVHDAGLIHRDVKPGNVVITRRGHVKLSDFGIAIRRDDPAAQGSQDEVVGTPAYLAPEVITGDPWTPAADLYALGVLAFRTLTGRLPFRGDDLRTIVLGHVHDRAPDPRPLAPDLPRGFAAFLRERLLAKDPARRPTAAEIATVLGPRGGIETTAVALRWRGGRVGRAAALRRAGSSDEHEALGTTRRCA